MQYRWEMTNLLLSIFWRLQIVCITLRTSKPPNNFFMNNIIRAFILIILLVSMPLVTYADEPSNDPSTPSFPLKKRKKDNEDPIRPKMPSFVQILFSYDYTACEALFEFSADVEYIDIEALNLESHIIYVGSVWAENPVWNQELPGGEYIITCTADNGDVYEGYVYI